MKCIVEDVGEGKDIIRIKWRKYCDRMRYFFFKFTRIYVKMKVKDYSIERFDIDEIWKRLLEDI